MPQNLNILSPRQPLAQHRAVDGKETPVFVDRSWWRFFNSLFENAGSLSPGVTIAPNSVITPGTINAGSTVTPAEIPAGTLLGNGTAGPAPAEPVVVGPGLDINGGTLDAATMPAFRLLGNPGGTPEKPAPIQIGTGLSFINNVLIVNPAGGGLPSVGLLEAIAYWRP